MWRYDKTFPSVHPSVRPGGLDFLQSTPTHTQLLSYLLLQFFVVTIFLYYRGRGQESLVQAPAKTLSPHLTEWRKSLIMAQRSLKAWCSRIPFKRETLSLSSLSLKSVTGPPFSSCRPCLPIILEQNGRIYCKRLRPRHVPSPSSVGSESTTHAILYIKKKKYKVDRKLFLFFFFFFVRIHVDCILFSRWSRKLPAGGWNVVFYPLLSACGSKILFYLWCTQTVERLKAGSVRLFFLKNIKGGFYTHRQKRWRPVIALFVCVGVSFSLPI